MCRCVYSPVDRALEAYLINRQPAEGTSGTGTGIGHRVFPVGMLPTEGQYWDVLFEGRHIQLAVPGTRNVGLT